MINTQLNMFNHPFNGFSETSWQSNSTPKIPIFKPELSHQLFDKDPLKKFNERLESLENSIKQQPIVQNFYTSDNTKIFKTHASTFERKSINPTKPIPAYVINGNVCCDNCKLGELLHGFHFDDPTGKDLCAKCFNSNPITNKESWTGFSISIQDNQN